MRVAVSGTTCQDKSTLVQDIITNWDNLYNEPEVTYQSIIDNIKGTEFKTVSNTMWKLITDLNREIYKFKEDTDNVIFNRCSLDVLAYSLWLKKKNINSIDDKFIERLKTKTRKCMKHLDIIFFVPIVDQQNIHITSKHENITDADISSIREIDVIFKSFIRDWRDGKNEFMPVDDCPAIIEVFGSREQRMKMVTLYIQPDGTQYDTSGNFMEDASNILNKDGVPAIKDGKYTQDEQGIVLNNLNEEV